MSNAVVVVGDAMRNFKLKLLLLQAAPSIPTTKIKELLLQQIHFISKTSASQFRLLFRFAGFFLVS